ncbi:DUF6480 family protein [Nocardia sp. CY41]|uniref:DUF6480 family protein n=1 Tax=Nocardia sp. CY41 TaxID=2608686 RepID=UPI001357C2E0|nr:DUF6480 family protein [Nocardia sp. CY41]
MSAMDPDPAKTPDLEPGGGVPPGSTPPDTPQTSGPSAPEPSTRHHFPVTGVVAMLIGAVIILLFVAAAVGIVVSML